MPSHKLMPDFGTIYSWKNQIKNSSTKFHPSKNMFWFFKNPWNFHLGENMLFGTFIARSRNLLKSPQYWPVQKFVKIWDLLIFRILFNSYLLWNLRSLNALLLTFAGVNVSVSQYLLIIAESISYNVNKKIGLLLQKRTNLYVASCFKHLFKTELWKKCKLWKL